MLHEYHVIYSVRYYLRFHVTAVGLGTYYPWVRGHHFISKLFCFILYFSDEIFLLNNSSPFTGVCSCVACNNNNTKISFIAFYCVTSTPTSVQTVWLNILYASTFAWCVGHSVRLCHRIVLVWPFIKTCVFSVEVTFQPTDCYFMCGY
jgi:hypothetical protein